VANTGGSRPARAGTRGQAAARGRRLPGVDVKPGSVRQARLEAGLSLAKVAEGHVSAPAVFLIEVGRSRPSLPTLEHIARRTAKPVEYFLMDSRGEDAADTALARLEDLIARQQFTDAVAEANELLKLATSASRLGNIRYLLGTAHLNLGRSDLAVPLLTEARGHFEATDDRLMLAECLGSLATVAYLTQDPQAGALVEQGLAICRALRPVPPITEARLLGIKATIHSVNREWIDAIKAYEKTIEVAGSFHDLRKLAITYGGLASSHREIGRLDMAAKYAARSVALFEVLRDQVSLARAENELGLLLLARGDKAAAGGHLQKSLALAKETNLEAGRSYLMLSFCELSLQESNADEARSFADQALELADKHSEKANIAEAHMWLGRIAAHEDDHGTADREFALAMRLAEVGGFDERLVRYHGAYAEVLEKRGDVSRAYEHMKKALAGTRPGLLRGDDETGAAEKSKTA
jgi:tetratricopeptide (TPR) repeat protein